MKFDFTSDIVFGFSQKSDGIMKLAFPFRDNIQTKQNIEKFCAKFIESHFCVVRMEQVHKNKIAVVSKNDCDKVMQNVDSLITNEPNIFLTAQVADCLPIVFYTKNPKIVGIVHAGWKGTLANISAKMVALMTEKFQVSPSDIFAIFGPSISSCCYEVKNDVFLLFQNAFDNNPQICQKREGRQAVDLRAANYRQLQNSGIPKEHIYAPIYCTSCQNDQYFSYRKEREKLAGEMAAVVALR